MPVRTIGAGDVRRRTNVVYRTANGKKLRTMRVPKKGVLTVPTTTTPATATTGGTLAAATYGYKVTQVTNGLESAPSAEVTQVTTGTTSTVTVNWNAVTGATSYKVYGRTSGGPWLLIATVTAPTVTYIDTGSVTPSGSPPAASQVRLTGNKVKDSVAAVPATTVHTVNAYQLRR